MFTPQRKAWPGWSPLYPERTEKAGKGASHNAPIDTILAITENGSREISPARSGLIRSVAGGDGSLIGQSETEIWRHFKEAGALDEGSIERKDRATLMAHISRLETELYDYQYNMGLLLMERKEWSAETEKLKSRAEDAEENLQRELAAKILVIAEAEKREDSLKQALATERLCVNDLEKALREMRAESGEIKLLAENKLKQAEGLISETATKALQAESKLHALDALQAELGHKQGIAERKLQEAEELEGIVRRERLAFKAQQETYEEELNHQKQTLLEWERKLEEGQARLLEGQKLLNQMEENICQTECALKKMKTDLVAMRKQMEAERSSVQLLEADCSSKLASVAIREEVALKKEIAMETKEQELLLLQEKLSNRECLLEQRDEGIMKTEILLSKERERIEALENALKIKETTLPEKQQNLIELQISMEQLKEEANSKKADYERVFMELELQKQELMEERERRRLAEKEKEELLKLQTCLKEQIVEYKSKENLVSEEAEKLNQEKERFQKELEMLEEKSESVKKEIEKLDEEAKRVSAWLLAEEVKLKEEKRILQDQMRKESEALRLEMETFARRLEQEKTDWFTSVEKEKEELVKDLERRRIELETSIARQKEDIENNFREEEMRMRTELEAEREKATAEVTRKKVEEAALERLELEKMREEIARQLETSEQKWVEITNSMNELAVEREKLKEEREALIKVRMENVQEAERLKNLKIQLQASQDNETLLLHGNGDKILQPGAAHAPLLNEAEVSTSQFPQNVDGGIGDRRNQTESPGHLSWLQKCTLVPPEKLPNSSGITRDLEESNASLGSELGGDQQDTRSDGGQVGFDLVSRSSASFTPSSSRGRPKKAKKAKTPSAKTPSAKMTPSTNPAANVNSKRLFEPHVQHEEIIGDHKYEEGLHMHDGRLMDSAAQSAMELHDKDTMSYVQTKNKRAFSQATDTMSEADTGDMEAESEITTGGKRRRRNKDLGIDLKETTPGMKRYNLRRSTVTKTEASKLVSGQEIHDQEQNLNEVKRNLW